MRRSRLLSGFVLALSLLGAAAVLRVNLPYGAWAIPQPPPRVWTTAGLPPELLGQSVDPRTWRPATEDERRETTDVLRAQFEAFRDGDYVRAFTTLGVAQSRPPHSPLWLQTLVEHYPEMGGWQTLAFGTAWADRPGQHVDVPVMVSGPRGRLRALYEMTREEGGYRVAEVTDIQPLPMTGRQDGR